MKLAKTKLLKKNAESLKKKTNKPRLNQTSLNIGDLVPDFQILSSDGTEFLLSKFLGKTVVLYFYPKDATPGCTREGHDFSQLKKDFESENAVVLGISRDSVQSHQKFIQKQAYSINLLSDVDEKACQVFSVIKEKNMYGRMVMGIERSTFIIDESGRLMAQWRKVQVDGHAEEVLERLRSSKK